MIDRDPARALIQRTAAIVAAAALPAPAAPRYDGYAFFAVAYAMSWHFGSLPARALARRGVFIDVLHRDQAADRERLQVPPGSPILVDYEIAGTLDCAELRRSGTRVIIAIDDDLPHAPPWVRTVTGQPGAPVVREFVKALEPKLRAAAGLVCPTARLAEWLAEYDVPVHVIPLAVPPLDELPRPGARPRGGIRLGWCGTRTHQGDLDILRVPLLDLLARRPDVRFVLAGQCFPTWAAGHAQIEMHAGAVLLPQYYAWLASLDLDGFVIPLADTAWGRAKPALKPLEACALGIPVLASRVGAYAEELRDEETALVVENTVEAWSAALTRLVNDAGLRAHLAEGGRAWASQNTIEETAPLWEKLWLT